MVKVCSNLDELRSVLNSADSKLVVVDFYATWCGPCKMIAPQIEEMSETMDDVIFLKVDVDEAEDISAEYSIAAMPTFILIKNGSKVDEMVGAHTDKLREMIAKHK